MIVIAEFIRIYKYVFKTVTGYNRLFVWAIIWISVDGFPLIPLNTNNRPLSIVFLLSFWVITKIQKIQFSKFEIQVFYSYLFLLIFSIIQSGFVLHSFRPVLKFGITGLFSFITISCCFIFFSSIIRKGSFEVLMKVITYILIISSIVPIVIGFLQVFALHIVASRQFLDPLFNFFSIDTDVYSMNRIKLTSNEPAQAGTYLLFVITFVWNFYNDNSYFKKVYLFILFVLLLFINSSVTYIILILLISASWLFLEPKNPTRVFRFSGIAFSTLGVSYIVGTYFLSDYTMNRFIQIFELINDTRMETWIRLASTDFSILDRFGTPIFGFISLKYTDMIGTGGEGFFLVYEKLLYDLFPELTSNSTLTSLLENDVQMTVKFLPSKIAAEFGVIGFIFFVYNIIRIYSINYYRYKLQHSVMHKGICVCILFSILSSYMASYFHFTTILIFMLCYFAASSNICHAHENLIR